MKEQDAAHSFEKGVDIICEECKSEKAIHYANNKYFCSGCFAKEYTRLRSDLQQERELRKECIALLDNINDDMIEDGESPNGWYVLQIATLMKKAEEI